jgi:hypothetical protein
MLNFILGKNLNILHVARLIEVDAAVFLYFKNK